MKIKRFTGPDMRQTIRQVRDTLGADAVILSNRKLAEGVEVVAATDYDESLMDSFAATPEVPDQQQAEREVDRKSAWDDVRYGRDIPPPAPAPAPAAKEPVADLNLSQDPAFAAMQTELKSLRSMLQHQLSGMAWDNEVKYHPLRARLLQRLIALGLSPTLAREIAQQVDEQDDIDHNWRMALGKLAHQLPVQDDDILNHKGVVAIVGATGVGKTTTVAKLAARYILRHGPKRVALITTDNYRVAAHEQLRSYARIMGAPLRIAADVDALQDALAQFHDKELILIDTAGMSQRDMRLNEQLELLENSGRPVSVYLTLAVNHQRAVLHDVVRSFKAVNLAGCILTKVDETTSLGGGLSVASEHQLPIAYISDGQQVPEDLHPARPHALVSRAVTIMREVGIGGKQDPISEHISGRAAHANG